MIACGKRWDRLTKAAYRIVSWTKYSIAGSKKALLPLPSPVNSRAASRHGSGSCGESNKRPLATPRRVAPLPRYAVLRSLPRDPKSRIGYPYQKEKIMIAPMLVLITGCLFWLYASWRLHHALKVERKADALLQQIREDMSSAERQRQEVLALWQEAIDSVRPH